MNEIQLVLEVWPLNMKDISDQLEGAPTVRERERWQARWLWLICLPAGPYGTGPRAGRWSSRPRLGGATGGARASKRERAGSGAADLVADTAAHWPLAPHGTSGPCTKLGHAAACPS